MLFHVFGNIAVPEDDALVVTIFGMSTFLGFAIGTALRSGYTSVAVCITTCGLFLPAPRSVFYRLFVYVFSRIKHIYILIWWSFLMLATLPAMHALSKIGKVSNIIGMYLSERLFTLSKEVFRLRINYNNCVSLS